MTIPPNTLPAIKKGATTTAQVGVSYLTAWTGFETLTKGFLTPEQSGYLADHSISFALIFVCVLVFMMMMPHFEAIRHPASVLMLATTLAGSIFVFMSQAPPKSQEVDLETAKALMQQDQTKGSYLAKQIDLKSESLPRLLMIADNPTINQPYGGLTPVQRAMRSGDIEVVKQIAKRADVDPYAIGNSWRISPLNYVPGLKTWGTDNVDYALRLENTKIVEPVLKMAVRRDYKFSKGQIDKMKRLKLDDKLIAQAMGLYDKKLTTQLNNRLNDLLKKD